MSMAKKTISILATDLVGNINFDASKTIPAMDIDSNQYDEGMSLYLQKLGVNRIDQEYNAAVRAFESQLQEQELAAKLQADLAAASAANMAVEAQANLGTGAAAVASEGRQAALSDTMAGIEETVIDTYQSGMQSLSEDYQSALESVLGKYDPATQTFEGLANYEQLSNSVTEAMAKVLALSIDPQTDVNSDAYIEILRKAGFIEQSTVPGEVILSSVGQRQIDMLVNGAEVNERQAIFGGKTLAYMLAEQMAMSKYSGDYLSEDGSTAWQSLSDTKRSDIIREYESWIYNNQDNLRLTAWDLYTKTDAGIELDTFWSTPALTDAVGVYSDKGTDITYLAAVSLDNPDGIDCTEDDLAATKLKLLNGEIPSNSYFVFNSGEMNDDDKYYYLAHGTVYETEYTAKNPPPAISIDSATVKSFGVYSGVGESGAQDKLIQRIIDCAKSGQIEDGTFICFEYGADGAGIAENLYMYSDGTFVRVSPDTQITYNGKTQSVSYWAAQSSAWREGSDVIYVGKGNYHSAAAEDILGVRDTFMGWGGSNKLDW